MRLAPQPGAPLEGCARALAGIPKHGANGSEAIGPEDP